VGVAPLLLSLDIDGTMEFGDPPGPLVTATVHEVVRRGGIVGCASSWPISSQAPLWLRHGVELAFAGGKDVLMTLRERFPAARYVHVGDTDWDASSALDADFEFLDVRLGPIDLLDLLES
jgi:hypothetical protein